MAERTRVLVPIAEPIGGQMSAVGIRQFEVGKALAPHVDVTFASPVSGHDESHGIPVVPCPTRAAFVSLLRTHDVLYTLGLNADRFLDVAASGIRVILDIYTPLAYEILESWPEVPTPLLSHMHRRVVRWTNAQISHADFIVCTNERQRDMWLGVMNAIGRLTAADTRRNPDCRELIDVASFGIPEDPPAGSGHPLRDRLPGVGAGDFLLLWSSKILAWQDPVTLLRAMHRLAEDEPRIRLVFLGVGEIPTGGKRNPFDPTSFRTFEAAALSDELGLTGRNVFFISERIPYRDIGNYYHDADAAVATYPDTLETRFCLGSRLLDYVWAGLPMVVTGGQLQRDFVEGQGLGIVVEPGNAAALAEAIRSLKDRSRGDADTTAFAAARKRLAWSASVDAIVSHCKRPAARTRRAHRRMWSARLALAEFMWRSLVIRMLRRTGGLGNT